MVQQGLFAYYDEPSRTNDMLTLAYIQDNNVDKVVFNSEMNPVALPKCPEMPIKYTEALKSFEQFMQFYREIKEEGTYSEIIAYYKLKYSKLSFMALHSKYTWLCNYSSMPDIEYSYNENVYSTILQCNEYACSRKCLLLAPVCTAKFLEKHGCISKARMLVKEAKKIAKATDNLETLKEIEREYLNDYICG
ncbi:hypothetical protein CWI42_011700 [Ordospora colligata]|uniref:Uncharacterized protein n=1 Tax=Ordospora colligata OC4 TaxID=1354746 RepID=A0A0B2UNH6_9MICR|nr:uncharacterized protein M896_011700 [Ordospora colligata OC4]KHN70515.1 hypothetical protein M896_011700 [Ordospora colligata OC4]TBU17265.1 hypothetical protein CWI41_011700 [Ordospora colligata]TBU17515.1 hypothetical protein CWI40_011700 [Ordospora colligata]TBU19695.1 hypothetical protein CWI42_011700 [Ordospora colligata]